MFTFGRRKKIYFQLGLRLFFAWFEYHGVSYKPAADLILRQKKNIFFFNRQNTASSVSKQTFFFQDTKKNPIE
jgi:hypothetical protein